MIKCGTWPFDFMFIQAHLNLKFSYIMVTLYKPIEMKFICKNSVIVPVDMKMWIKASQRFKHSSFTHYISCTCKANR